MKRVLALLVCTATALSACATVYEVHTCHEGTCTDVMAKSFRNFEQPSVSYRREDGTTFNFNAGSASQQVSPLEQAAAGIIMSLPTLLGTQPLPAAAPPND